VEIKLELELVLEQKRGTVGSGVDGGDGAVAATGVGA
jgi:hypothetical protein